jgi:hypothetical protein
MGRDDDDTPRERLIVRHVDAGRSQLQHSASNHPRVKVARVWQSTIITVVTSAVVGSLAALQSWPPELTLGALGLASGLWTLAALKR